MKNNQKKHRKENVAGQFITAKTTITRNKSLSSDAKILLIEIFSDSDTFNLSRTTYCNRLGWDVSKWKRTIDELACSGFLTRTENDKNKKTKFYVISEFGNLKKEEPKQKTTPSKKTKTVAVDLKESNEVVELITEPISNEVVEAPKSAKQVLLDEAIEIVTDIVDRLYPLMPDDVYSKYIKDIKEAIVSGQIDSMKMFNEKAIIKSISKIYTEPQVEEEPLPAKLSITECEAIIKNKMTGGTVNQRGDTVKKVKEWFVNNGYIANEEQIRSRTFTVHNDSKTSGRVLDQKYQD